ncbi:pyridoxamine 5'-phosphate oxidase [Devosia sp. FKR38]|uniref:pyridoxamine 5'-phosphate oxidase n=1 Tax=Devosia sp. FKR38 TaxID=2562312 RepID=UPI0014851AD6|nr:pyridoxamine 5'-phosphate oxidase [Devosia sp. FKR38]
MSQAFAGTVDSIFIARGESSQDDPLFTLERWLREARAAIGFAANAMALASVGSSGDPDVRVVLLQAIRHGELVFFTNLDSPKGRQLLQSGKAALCFYWPEMGRQVRVRGRAALVEEPFADEYFATRPRGSQIGAHASAQSTVIASRSALLDRVSAIDARYAGIVPRPSWWSGFCVKPAEIEFWEDGVDRLHDRLLFSRSEADGAWSASRLSP